MLAFGGRWLNDQPISIRMVVGVGGIALFLALIAEADVKLAQQMGLLILIGAVFLYGPPLVKALGLTK